MGKQFVCIYFPFFKKIVELDEMIIVVSFCEDQQVINIGTIFLNPAKSLFIFPEKYLGCCTVPLVISGTRTYPIGVQRYTIVYIGD